VHDGLDVPRANASAKIERAHQAIGARTEPLAVATVA
jgi:hypothetical protein